MSKILPVLRLVFDIVTLSSHATAVVPCRPRDLGSRETSAAATLRRQRRLVGWASSPRRVTSL